MDSPTATTLFPDSILLFHCRYLLHPPYGLWVQVPWPHSRPLCPFLLWIPRSCLCMPSIRWNYWTRCGRRNLVCFVGRCWIIEVRIIEVPIISCLWNDEANAAVSLLMRWQEICQRYARHVFFPLIETVEG